MLIFIDTEFTDFKQAELISLGLVSEDGQHEFYAELPVNLARCNDFVIATVLPLLGKIAGAKSSKQELTTRLKQWLADFADQQPVICFDYEGDWQLFCAAMNDEIPEWLGAKNIDHQLDPLELQLFFIENKLSQHHALYDARANRHAFRADKVAIDTHRFNKSR